VGTCGALGPTQWVEVGLWGPPSGYRSGFGAHPVGTALVSPRSSGQAWSSSRTAISSEVRNESSYNPSTILHPPGPHWYDFYLSALYSQRTYDAITRLIPATTVAVEKKYHLFWVCVCSSRYPAHNAHAPYWHVACPALQYFPTLSHKDKIFEKKKVIGHKMGVSFSLKRFSEIFFFHSKKNWARYDRKYTGLWINLPT